jgi:hypothetical protein
MDGGKLFSFVYLFSVGNIKKDHSVVTKYNFGVFYKMELAVRLSLATSVR